MPAPDTRVSTPLLTTIVAAVFPTVQTLDDDLANVLVVLTDDERKAMPRVRTGLPAAARTLAEVLITRPEICAASGYDPAKVIEDLDNVAVIAKLVPLLKTLLQRLEDSQLQWLAEAQEPTLAAYAVAKVRAERDGSLKELIRPVQEVLANGPRPKDAAEKA
jgi:hypothetical protein